MTQPFIGEIQLFGFNFNPRGWAFANGATLPISQNTALYSLLGTIYGGNGHDYMEGGDGFDSADGYPGDMSCTPQTMTIVKYILAGSDVYC